MDRKRLKAWFSGNTNNIRLLIILIFLLLAIWAITLQNNNLVIGYSGLARWFTTALISVAPELAGIVIGVVTIDYLNERRQEQQLKAQLIRQMGSQHNDVVAPAVRELAYHGWLEDGSLQGADLTEANLVSINLIGANLTRTKLLKANLSRAILFDADLSGAFLRGANLKKAKYNSNTKWPDDFNPNSAGAELMSEFEWVWSLLQDDDFS